MTDTRFIKVGDRVRRLGGEHYGPKGQAVGSKIVKYDDKPWICVGDEATVVKHREGIPDDPCGSHAPECDDDCDDCLFGLSTVATIKFDHGAVQCIHPEDENDTWERIKK